ncbi:MAG TPA: permease, partial [Deltaproteobacteria bacterium]|nr:permease [Deltaproteobacteria bacterium]
MTTLVFSAIVAGVSFCAGFLGSLTGLGGGVVIVPLLTLVFGADIRYAIGASLISIIATSSGAAAAYVKEGFTNIRIGMLLEIATTIGALVGASLVAVIPANVIAVIFGLVLLQSAYLASRHRPEHATANLPADPLAARLRLDG